MSVGLQDILHNWNVRESPCLWHILTHVTHACATSEGDLAFLKLNNVRGTFNTCHCDLEISTYCNTQLAMGTTTTWAAHAYVTPWSFHLIFHSSLVQPQTTTYVGHRPGCMYKDALGWGFHGKKIIYRASTEFPNLISISFMPWNWLHTLCCS